MEFIHGEKGRLKTLWLEIQQNVDGLSGESPTIAIKRLNDNKYFDGTTFVVAVTFNSMVEFDATNHPGLYTFDFTPDEATRYVIHKKNTGTFALDEYDILEAVPAGTSILSTLQFNSQGFIKAVIQSPELLLIQRILKIVESNQFEVRQTNRGMSSNQNRFETSLRRDREMLVNEIKSLKEAG